MKYYKSLAISFLIHSLAFASTTWMIGRGKYHNSEELSVQSLTMNVQWVEECLTENKKEPSAKVEPKLIVKNPLPVKKMNVSSTPRSSLRITSAVKPEQLPKQGNVSLIPYKDNPFPIYPEQARQKELKGEMMLKLTVDALGHVKDIQILKGQEIDDCLKQAAFEAVRKWRFIRSDQSAELVSVTLPVNFNLEA